MNKQRISRREFMKLAGVAGISATGLAACVPAATPAPPAPPPAATMLPVEAGPTFNITAGSDVTTKLRAAYIPETNDVLAAIIKDWGKKNNVNAVPDLVSMDDLPTIAATAAETGTGPDIIELYVSQPHLFAEKLVEVSEIAEYIGKENGGWIDFAKEGCFVNGKWMAVPRYMNASVIYWREDYFQKIGYDHAPATWDEMLEVGIKLKEAGLPPVGFPLGHAVGDGNDFAYTILWSFGGKEVEADGKTVALDSPETAKAVDFVRELFDKAMPPDVLAWDDGSNNRAFHASEISACNNSASIYVTAKTNAPEVYPVTNLAKWPEGPAGRLTYAEMMSQAVFSYSKNSGTAKALINYLNEREWMAPYIQSGYCFVIPLLKDYEDMVTMPWNTNPKLAAFKGIANTAHLPGYPSQAYRQAAEAYNRWIILDMFAKACSGGSTKDVVSSAASELKKIYV